MTAVPWTIGSVARIERRGNGLASSRVAGGLINPTVSTRNVLSIGTRSDEIHFLTKCSEQKKLFKLLMHNKQFDHVVKTIIQVCNHTVFENTYKLVLPQC